ncbi:ribose-5-phosphate isomerase [Iodidimonas muriae]|uniref:Ribose-5-phosphate isomerase n=1 Tax=Iodidimonas muriae TaxID=261467 RepID=A0ABQ2LGS0_9PROT|nr:ribose 5-phosphate isomerase B [Iodidimonas muriae]GER08322.1 ribose-5-phosphate isomerase [Kordiimonadales bacterium JCM 17843]GGO16288.1 ribose-5-phosphate isomerase [Iodidimonas muriae]
MAEHSIAVAADHAGLALKTQLIAHLETRGWTVTDLGTHDGESVDYPDYGYALAKVITEGRVPFGLVVCGSGIGISMAANRYPSVRCALCSEPLSAQLARQHNDANVLALGGRLIGEAMATTILDAFLDTPFEGGRHQRRVDKLGSVPQKTSC